MTHPTTTWAATKSGASPLRWRLRRFSRTPQAADFSAGTLNSCVADGSIGDGAVRLPLTIDEAFSGTALPTGWSSVPWGGGGTSAVDGDQITVDGALAASETYYASGRAVEFVATFGNATYQNIGFGQALATGSEYWAMFGISDTANGLYARTNLNNAITDTLLAGSWLGAPHRYRIEWTASQILFYIDGALVHTANVAITQNMRPVISDYAVGGTSVSVDWLQLNHLILRPALSTSACFRCRTTRQLGFNLLDRQSTNRNQPRLELPHRKYPDPKRRPVGGA